MDGGFGDADGVANGVVVDPSGTGVVFLNPSGTGTTTPNSAIASPSSGQNCFIEIFCGMQAE